MRFKYPTPHPPPPPSRTPKKKEEKDSFIDAQLSNGTEMGWGDDAAANSPTPLPTDLTIEKGMSFRVMD